MRLETSPSAAKFRPCSEPFVGFVFVIKHSSKAPCQPHAVVPRARRAPPFLTKHRSYAVVLRRQQTQAGRQQDLTRKIVQPQPLPLRQGRHAVRQQRHFIAMGPNRRFI